MDTAGSMLDSFEQGLTRCPFKEEQVKANTGVTPSGYKYIRESGMLCLLSKRTLCDYRSYKDFVPGVDIEYIMRFPVQYHYQ